ncbi:hypothetical protein Dimus_036802 [Dionaea muscipula]
MSLIKASDVREALILNINIPNSILSSCDVSFSQASKEELQSGLVGGEDDSCAAIVLPMPEEVEVTPLSVDNSDLVSCSHFIPSLDDFLLE